MEALRKFKIYRTFYVKLYDSISAWSISKENPFPPIVFPLWSRSNITNGGIYYHAEYVVVLELSVVYFLKFRISYLNSGNT